MIWIQTKTSQVWKMRKNQMFPFPRQRSTENHPFTRVERDDIMTPVMKYKKLWQLVAAQGVISWIDGKTRWSYGCDFSDPSDRYDGLEVLRHTDLPAQSLEVAQRLINVKVWVICWWWEASKVLLDLRWKNEHHHRLIYLFVESL